MIENDAELTQSMEQMEHVMRWHDCGPISRPSITPRTNLAEGPIDEIRKLRGEITHTSASAASRDFRNGRGSALCSPSRVNAIMTDQSCSR
jgi:hypothetical protein